MTPTTKLDDETTRARLRDACADLLHAARAAAIRHVTVGRNGKEIDRVRQACWEAGILIECDQAIQAVYAERKREQREQAERMKRETDEYQQSKEGRQAS